MSVIGAIRDFATHTVQSMGYPGIALLMGLDSMCIPIPSEAIMPTGGILAEQGKLNIILVGLAGTVGSTIGSWACYWLGSCVSKEFLLKYGKYILLRQRELEHAEQWFEKYGLIATLFGRFVPVVRTFISLPAGMYRADFKKFAIYSLIGSAPWAFLWAFVGYALSTQMKTIEGYLHIADYVVAGALLLLIVRFLLLRSSKVSSKG